jgi:D-alanine-D-alanine ligase
MKKVLLLFGGRSTEHDVSIMSARNIYGSIDWNKFQAALGYISPTGQLSLVDDFDSLDEGQELWPVIGAGQFRLADSEEFYTPDVIFPIIHGRDGEDGAIQGLAQLMSIPVVGSGIEASAICLNKLTTKRLLEAAGIDTVPYVGLIKGDPQPSYSELAKQLGRNLFIKPARQGSSVGVSKVSQATDLPAALQTAFKHDDIVLIEKAINGRELEAAVLGNPPNVEVSGVGEILADSEFYDYDAKYAPTSTAQAVIPADINSRIFDDIQEIAQRTFQVLGCRGLARVDFFLTSNQRIYVNEVNTLPGFTNISMYPKLWLDAGLQYPELVTKLIELALG